MFKRTQLHARIRTYLRTYVYVYIHVKYTAGTRTKATTYTQDQTATTWHTQDSHTDADALVARHTAG